MAKKPTHPAKKSAPVSSRGTTSRATSNTASRTGGNGAANASGTGIASTSAVRNSAVPKASKSRVVNHDQIARRAYEIYLSGADGTEQENWLRAERELRGA